MAKPRTPNRDKVHPKTSAFVANLKKYAKMLEGEDKILMEKVIKKVEADELRVNPFQTPEALLEKAKRHLS